METVTIFLGTHFSREKDYSRIINIRVLVKKTKQRLHFLLVLRRNNLYTRLLVAFYPSSVESLPTYCLGVWYAGSTAKNKKVEQKVINTAQKFFGCPLPTLEGLSSLPF